MGVVGNQQVALHLHNGYSTEVQSFHGLGRVCKNCQKTNDARTSDLHVQAWPFVTFPLTFNKLLLSTITTSPYPVWLHPRVI
jgi:hypothetical protein